MFIIFSEPDLLPPPERKEEGHRHQAHQCQVTQTECLEFGNETQQYRSGEEPNVGRGGYKRNAIGSSNSLNAGGQSVYFRYYGGTANSDNEETGKGGCRYFHQYHCKSNEACTYGHPEQFPRPKPDTERIPCESSQGHANGEQRIPQPEILCLHHNHFLQIQGTPVRYGAFGNHHDQANRGYRKQGLQRKFAVFFLFKRIAADIKIFPSQPKLQANEDGDENGDVQDGHLKQSCNETPGGRTYESAQTPESVTACHDIPAGPFLDGGGEAV